MFAVNAMDWPVFAVGIDVSAGCELCRRQQDVQAAAGGQRRRQVIVGQPHRDSAAWRARRATVRLLGRVDAATLRDLGITDTESAVYGDPRDRMRGYDADWWKKRDA